MTALIPCWLMTPDMVSAIMPLERAMFDLVIFDEASQCFSERGLPAIYRAKQLVIAGDDKQLQPFDLGRIRFVSDTEEEEDTDEVVALEARSLLELSRQFLSGDMLRTHYRSRSLDLISFSNVQFYEGKLQTIPHFHTIQEQVRGVQWIKVPGVLKDSTNHIEAEKAIQVVLDLVRAGETSLGIVSFNAAQQELITDLLRLRAQQEQITLPKGLFVKNIENVQGDERDIIVLSITYAKDDKGVFRRHFGDLSLAGGENKLNVAVTRARKQIYVISSISGGDINSESLANQGPKLLEAYLRYAEQVSVGSFEEAAVKGNPQISAYKLSDKMAGKKESLRKNLSFADLVEYQGTTPASLILTDDDLYFQRSSKEAHGYLPLILNQKGWQYRYYYSRGWYEGR
jgi:superfamily I DNA and/or RNA helicase